MICLNKILIFIYNLNNNILTVIMIKYQCYYIKLVVINYV